MTSTDTLLPCEHCGCRFGYHEAGCAALVDDIVSVAVTGFKADMERIMAGHPETKPGDMTSEQQCMMVAEASGWRARALKAEAEIAASRTPPTPATEEREAVALAMLNGKRLREGWPITASIPEGFADGDEWRLEAQDALSALAPYRAAEILAAEANERARIVAWLRATSTGLDLTKRRIADAIERNEQGAGK